jgi:hypothetical protein
MMMYGGVDVQIHMFLSSAVVGGVICFSLAGFNPGEKAPGTYCIGGWVGTKNGLDDVKRIKTLSLPGLELRTRCHPVRSLSLYRLNYPGSLKCPKNNRIMNTRKQSRTFDL